MHMHKKMSRLSLDIRLIDILNKTDFWAVLKFRNNIAKKLFTNYCKVVRAKIAGLP